MPKHDPVRFALAKQRLQAGLRKIIATHEEIRADLEWWNANRTDAPPIDVGGDIAVAAIASQVLELVDTEQMIPLQLWDRLQTQLDANVRNGNEVAT